MLLSAYKKPGDMLRNLHRLDEAEPFFLRAAEVTESVARAFPGNASVANDQFVSSMSFGELLVARDKYEGALARFERAIQIAQQALIANPADSTMKRHLFVGLLARRHDEVRVETGSGGTCGFRERRSRSRRNG